MMKQTRRIGVLLLSVALLIGQFGATAYAEGPPSTGGLCEHHTAHDDACGYVEAVEGHACEHEHTTECYTDELICGDTDGDAGHQHGQECYKPGCPHERGEHDTACGYIAGVKGTPCGYVCNQCGGEPDKDSGTTSVNNSPAPVETAPGTVEPEDAGTIRVMVFDEMGGGVKVQTVPKGTKLESLTRPVTLGASGYTVAADTEPVPKPITITGVTWELTGENNTPTIYEDGRTTSCSYYFQPVLPEGYTLDNNAELPKIEVRYGWGTRANTGNYNDDDKRAFQAILNTNPALKSVTGVNENDPASWETAGLVTWRNGRLIALDLDGKGLTGTLDVSSLSRLESLVCNDNPDIKGRLKLGTHNELESLLCSNIGLNGTLNVSGFARLAELTFSNNPGVTELKMGTHNNLALINCGNTGIKGELDVSRYSKLAILNCNDTNLTKLKMGTHDNLTLFDANNSRLEGTLDVSRCSSLYLFSCANNPGLAELKMGTHHNLTLFDCENAGLKGTLDVSGFSGLKSFSCANNPGLTELKMGAHDKLYYFSCSNTGLRGTLDVSGYPQLEGFQCEAETIVLRDGTIQAQDGGKVKVEFSSISSLLISFTLTAIPDGGRHFTGWAGLPDGADETMNPVSFAPGTGYTYTAHFASDGGEDDSNSDDNNAPVPATPKPPQPDHPVLTVIELSVTVEDDTAAGSPDDERTASAIAEAAKDARAGTNGIAVQYDAKIDATCDGFSIVIRQATLDRLIAARVKYVSLHTGLVDLTFDLAALKELAAKSTGDITLTATEETGLTGDARTAVGSRPAWRLAVSYTGADGKAATVQNFGAGSVAVGLAYTPAATEQAGGLYMVYSKDGKGVEWLYRSGHDANSGNVIGSTGHFSLFGVGYKPAPAFTDTVNHWAKADIDFVASRGLLTGTGDTTFTPDSIITRGMFVTALGRLAGIDPAAYPSSSRFTDVPANAYYAPYVEWAAGKGIVNGTGENSFSPDAAITREQMAAIMQRYADKLGYALPVAREGEIFADDAKITGSMKDAVWAMQQAGIMSGKGGYRFGPKDTATRAEASAVLRRFVKIVIDRTTADGWAQNETGRWLYYLDAKPVTGWNQIESKWYYFDTAGLMQTGGWKEIGGKWYYFYPDGAMAANTTIDSYEIGPDGVRKEN